MNKKKMNNISAGKINILFVIIQIDIMGGSERLVYNLALNLDRTVFNPSIAWFHGKNRLEDFKDLGVPLYHVPKTKSFDFSTMKRLGNIIKDNNIHIVNAHHFMSMVYSFYGCKIINHRKLIYTEHSEWEIEKISWKWKKAGSFLLRFADGAMGVSSKVTKLMQDRFKLSPAKAFTIQNGVDIKTFKVDVDKLALKRKLGIESNEKIIGVVANFRKIKNHIFLLKAFNELVNVFKPVKLLLIGEGVEGDNENTEEEIRNFVDRKTLKTKVLILGYRSDVSDLLCIMDIFCLTSFKEGLPISMIEAMAAGLPVVGTDVEGIKDVIIPNKNGFLVEPDDIECLKDVLNKLLYNDSLREKFGQESKSLVMNNYSLKRCVNKYQELFVSLMNKKKS